MKEICRSKVVSRSPKVSVVMSVYNEEKYVREATDSILNQTFRDFEFIIIDDGSTDGTRRILEAYSDSRIHIIHQRNMGLTKSLNRAIELAQGEYIARMDGNDISMPERLEKQVDFLDRHPRVGVVGTYAVRIDQSGRDVGVYTYKTSDVDIKRHLWTDCPFLHTSVMFRRECVDKVGYYREKIRTAQDYDLWFRISESYDLANIDQPLHKFRVLPKGVSVDKKFDQIRSYLLIRHLARERRKAGHDSLDQWNSDELNGVLERLLPRNRANERKVYYSTAIYLAEVFYVTKRYLLSARWLKRAIMANPICHRNWFLGCKLIFCALLPSGAVDRLRMLSRETRRRDRS